MKISDKKTALRINAKNIRKSLSMDVVSSKLVSKIQQTAEYINAKHIMLFYPTKYEVNLLELLNDKTKEFYFPRVNGCELQVCPYSLGDELNKSRLNILEPCSNPINAKILDLIIVPALLVDSCGYRLGYGGGFYDKFLSEIRSDVKTICAIPKELFVEELPHDDFDIPVNKVIKG